MSAVTNFLGRKTREERRGEHKSKAHTPDIRRPKENELKEA